MQKKRQNKSSNQGSSDSWKNIKLEAESNFLRREERKILFIVLQL